MRHGVKYVEEIFYYGLLSFIHCIVLLILFLMQLPPMFLAALFSCICYLFFFC